MNCISVDQRDSKTVLRRERSLHEELIRFWRLKYIMFLSWLWQACEPAELLPSSPALCQPEAFSAPGAAPSAGEAKFFFLLLCRVHWSKARVLAFGWCQQSWDRERQEVPPLSGGIFWHQLSFTSTIILIWEGWHISDQLTALPPIDGEMQTSTSEFIQRAYHSSSVLCDVIGFRLDFPELFSDIWRASLLESPGLQCGSWEIRSIKERFWFFSGVSFLSQPLLAQMPSEDRNVLLPTPPHCVV